MAAPIRTRRQSFSYDQYKNDLYKRTQESFDKKDFSGRFGTYIKEEFRNRVWKDSEGSHYLDIIPYKAGADHPSLEEGEYGFLLDFYVHRGVGANEDTIICLAKTFKGGQCPVCELQREMRRSGEYTDDEVNALSASRRTLYNIICRDNEKEQEKGVQLYDIAQWFFDKHLAARSRTRSGELINYAMPDLTGKTIQFEKQGKKGTLPDYLGHTFLDREEPIEPELLEEAIPLDQVIIIPEYEEVKTMLDAGIPAPRQNQASTTRTAAPQGPVRRVSSAPPPAEPVARRPHVVQQEEAGCPGGGQFGVDIDSLPACPSCEIWDDCAEEERRLKSQEEGEVKEAPPPPPPKSVRRAPGKPAAPAPITRRRK